MSVASFIPQIWNADMLLQFREATVATGLVNREYEGDATKGNTVKVTSAAAVSVFDYSIGEGNGGTSGTPLPRTTAAEAVSSTTVDLLIDQEKNFDFKVDDIDRAQAAGSMSVYTVSAGQGLAEDADKFILASAVTSAGTSITGDGAATPVALTTPDEFLNVLRDLRKALNKAHVPQGNRVAVVNAEFEAVLLDASSKLTQVDKSGSAAGLRNAYLGNLLGFEIYTSENLPEVNKPQVAAWYRPALAFVSQIEETEAMRAQDSFADRLRGLHVYGGKAIRPTGIAAWTNA